MTGLILLGFGTTFYLLFRNEEDSNDILQGAFETYAKSISSTFGIMLGDFNFNRFYDSKVPLLGTLLAILFLVIVMIIMLNLLIAIMGDSYNRIKSNEEISFYIARAQIICDVESKLFDRSIRTIKFNFKFLYFNFFILKFLCFNFFSSKLIKEYFHILYMRKINSRNTTGSEINGDLIVEKLIPSLEKYMSKIDKSSTPNNRGSKRYHRLSDLWSSKDENLLVEASTQKKLEDRIKKLEDKFDTTLNNIEQQMQSIMEEIKKQVHLSSST